MSRSGTPHFLIRKPVSCVVTKPKWLYMSSTENTYTYEVHREQRNYLKQLDHPEYKRITHQCTVSYSGASFPWSKNNDVLFLSHDIVIEKHNKSHPVRSRHDCLNTYLSVLLMMRWSIRGHKHVGQHCPRHICSRHISSLVCIS